MEIRFEPIGFVRNAYSEQRPVTWQGVLSQIHIESTWCRALDGLEGFSHIVVLCYLDRSRGADIPLRIRAQRNPEMPLVGFWGTRTPVRPNPISMTVVPLIEREGCVLHVQNLDMFDGTAVLDIKPYLIRGDCHPEATAPEWIHRLWRMHDERRS
jgi:tRNA-Thr(GGU) m(6)t(6)A37 methyltransferase TsaA